MIDLKLQAATETAAITALQPLGLHIAAAGQQPAQWITSGPGWALALIDPVVTTPAVLDASGNVTTPAEIAPEFHLDLRVAFPGHPLIAAVQGWVINVAFPKHGWA